MKNIIIHISGYQNYDKKIIGNKLKDKYNDNIYIKYLDDLKKEFYQQKEIDNYQDFINLFIEKHNDKPLILLGLSVENINNNDETFYVIDTKYKYFINDNDNIMLKQQWQKNNIAYKKIHRDHNYIFIDDDKIINKVFRIIYNKHKYMKNYKIIKELGVGIQGSVYLVKNKITKRKYAMKVQQVFENDLIENFKSPIWREIDFAKHMSSKYPQQFMKIYKYKNKKCKYVHNLSEKKWNDLKNDKQQYKYYKDLYASPYCSIKITSIVDDTLHYIIYKINDKKIILDLFIQVVNIAYLINKEGYYHRDLYPTNIGVIFTKDKYINILGRQILTHGYILSAIDYGMVINKKYVLNNDEKDALNYDNDLRPSLNRIILKIMLKNLISKYYPKIYINTKVHISDKEGNTLEPILKNIKVNNSKWLKDNYDYFQEILYKIIFFDKFQEQLGVNEKVELFEFIPVESIKFIMINYYDLKKILEHLMSL
jgi:hypothetical protein